MAVYAFIDSQNLNLGVRSAGWQLDFQKFRQFLHEKYDVSKVFLFFGYRPDNEHLYRSLRRKGYILIFKPTLQKANGTIKGNVDVELALRVMLQYSRYDKAIIVSGDGDFYSLAEYLEKEDKLLRILVPNRHFSRLLGKFQHYIVRIDKLRDVLEFENKNPGASGRSKP